MKKTSRRALSTLGAIVALALTIAGSCDRSKQGVQPEASTTKSSPQPSSGSDDPVEIERINDVHLHLNPAAYPYFLELADQLGIERAVNLSGDYRPEVLRSYAQLPRRRADRIAPFMNIDWNGVEEPDFAAERAADLERAVTSGYAGLKISKALGLGVRVDGELLAVDDPRLDPIFEKAGDLGVPVAIHTADPKAFFEPMGPQNERSAELEQAPSWSFHGDEFPSRKSLLEARDRLVARHADTTFILVHFANNPEDLDYVTSVLERSPNALVDISARVGEIGRHPPERVRALFERFSDRILFGTDLQYFVGSRGGRPSYMLTLGSISEEPPRLPDVEPFYDAHARWLLTSGEPIEHPIPIQGDWKVNPIGLGKATAQKVYWRNSERVVFAPWLGRKRALETLEIARSLTTTD